MDWYGKQNPTELEKILLQPCSGRNVTEVTPQPGIAPPDSGAGKFSRIQHTHV